MLPTTALSIRVDLVETADSWTGWIDIPAQGLRASTLGDVKVAGADVSFSMPDIPGDPKFSGTLSSDAQAIRGEFTQGEQRFPFAIDRKAKTASTIGETPGKGVPGEGLAGHWQGSLKPSATVELRMVLEVTAYAPGKTVAMLISVDQGFTRIPVTTVTQMNDGTVRLGTQQPIATFEGRFSADGSEIAGDWKQAAGSLPLVFKRLAHATDFSRPQDPKPPYPYDTEEVSFENAPAGIRLAGTLTKPRSAERHAVVVLVTGSGPQDRDETMLGHRPFLVLADHLTRLGVAVLRYDDRGVGESTGDFAKATHHDFVSDALAAVSWLKSRADIDPKRIGIVGHSEGGIVAPIAATQRPDDIAFIVLLAGVGVRMDELLPRQSQDIQRLMGLDDESVKQTAVSQRAIYDLLGQKLEQTVLEERLRALIRKQLSALTGEHRKLLGDIDVAAELQVQMSITPWFRELVAYDPRPILRQVKCPVLAINGQKDTQVASQDNLASIREALKAGGNQHVTTQELPGLNHLFQSSTTGAPSEYALIEETFAPAALTAVSDWILVQINSR